MSNFDHIAIKHLFIFRGFEKTTAFTESKTGHRARYLYADRRLRPFARRLFSTARPPGVAIRALNPWVRLRFKLLGWNVLFIILLPKNLRYCFQAENFNEITVSYQWFIALISIILLRSTPSTTPKWRQHTNPAQARPNYSQLINGIRPTILSGRTQIYFLCKVSE